MHAVLVAPEIATNTGNIIRLCANVGASLHLVDPLGFELDDRHLRRAGLDYHELAPVRRHPDLAACLAAIGAAPSRCFALSGRGERNFAEVRFAPDDVVVFGAERAGLSPDTLARFAPAQRLHIPMRPANRSLNLANAVAVVLYEAWRQQGYAGAAPAASAGGTLAESTASVPFDPPPGA